MMLIFTLATPDDVDALLARGVRASDRRECAKAAWRGLDSALRFSLAASVMAVGVHCLDPRKAAALTGKPPKTALFDGEARTLRQGRNRELGDNYGRILALFGVAQDPAGHGLIWLAATDEFARPDLAVPLARASRRYVNCWLREFKCLHNVVDPDNAPALRWLEWLGFDIDRKSPVRGPLGHELYRFRRCLGTRHGN